MLSCRPWSRPLVCLSVVQSKCASWFGVAFSWCSSERTASYCRIIESGVGRWQREHLSKKTDGQLPSRYFQKKRQEVAQREMNRMTKTSCIACSPPKSVCVPIADCPSSGVIQTSLSSCLWQLNGAPWTFLHCRLRLVHGSRLYTVPRLTACSLIRPGIRYLQRRTAQSPPPVAEYYRLVTVCAVLRDLYCCLSVHPPYFLSAFAS